MYSEPGDPPQHTWTRCTGPLWSHPGSCSKSTPCATGSLPTVTSLSPRQPQGPGGVWVGTEFHTGNIHVVLLCLSLGLRPPCRVMPPSSLNTPRPANTRVRLSSVCDIMQSGLGSSGWALWLLPQPFPTRFLLHPGVDLRGTPLPPPRFPAPGSGQPRPTHWRSS